jgi:hypothetical protein
MRSIDVIFLFWMSFWILIINFMVGFFSFKFFSFLIPKLLPFLLFYEFTDNKMEAVIDCLFVFCFWIHYMVVGDYKERGITLELKSPKMILKLPVSGLPMVFQFFFFF